MEFLNYYFCKFKEKKFQFEQEVMLHISSLFIIKYLATYLKFAERQHLKMFVSNTDIKYED